MNEKSCIIIAWYHPVQWAKIREISRDRDQFSIRYIDWLEQSYDTYYHLKSSGYNVEKVDIDADELEEWCKFMGYEVNGNSRSDFAIQKLKDRKAGINSATTLY